MKITGIDRMPIINVNSIRLLNPLTGRQVFQNELYYYKKKGTLIQLKRGSYVSESYVNHKPKGYERFLANQLYQPSYISLTTALNYYTIFSESDFVCSSISTKKTWNISNKIGSFAWRNITPDLFCGYCKETIGEFQVFMASKAKALFDFFRYNKKKFDTLDKDMFESLRLNLQKFTAKDCSEFKKYASLSSSKKMIDIYILLKEVCGKTN